MDNFPSLKVLTWIVLAMCMLLIHQTITFNCLFLIIERHISQVAGISFLRTPLNIQFRNIANVMDYRNYQKVQIKNFIVNLGNLKFRFRVIYWLTQFS